MIYCLSCRYISPAAALFCNRCGRTFGARLCPSRHKNPMDAQYCIQCGKNKLTDATRYLAFGWLSRLILWGAIFLCLRWAFGHMAVIMQDAAALLRWALVDVLGINLCSVYGLLSRLLAWLIILLLLTFFIPQPYGPRLRAILIGFVQKIIPVSMRIVRQVIVGLWHCVEGSPKRK